MSKNNRKSNRSGLTPSQQKEVQRLVRTSLARQIETKVTYTTQSGGIDYSGSVFNMCSALTKADGAIDAYTGNLLRPSYLRLKYSWNTGQTYNTVRIFVFQFEDASSPAASGILQYTATNLAPHSPINWLNHHKIHVLADHVHTIFPVAGSYAACSGELEVPGNRLKTIQMPNSGGGATPQMNGLYALAISDDSAPSYPQLEFISELQFTDA